MRTSWEPAGPSPARRRRRARPRRGHGPSAGRRPRRRCRGSKPAAAQRARVWVRMPEGARRTTKGSSATSARATRVPVGQRVRRRDGEDERLDEDATPLDVRAGDPVGGELDVGPSGGELLGHPPALPHRGALRGRRGPVGGRCRKARISPGTSQEPRLSGKASVTTPPSGSTSSSTRRQPVVEVVDERVDVPLEGRTGVRHPQHPAGTAQQRGADLLLQPGQRPRDAGLAHPEDVTDLGDGVAVGDELEPAQRCRVHPMTIVHARHVPISLDAWTRRGAHWSHEHLNTLDHRQGRAPRASRGARRR